MKTRRAALAALLVMLLTLAVAASGCGFLVGAGLGAGAAYGGYRYTQGAFETDYRHPLDQTYNATLASLKQMNMPVTKTQKDAVGAQIEANRSDGTPVTIDLKKTGPETTNATIRVGRIGDEDASRTIANRIAQDLKEPIREPTGKGGQVQEQPVSK